MLTLSKFKIYISFLVYKLLNGFLFSISIFLFASGSSVLTLLPIMILQEFYFSYFYTAKKNQSIELKKSFPIYYYFSSSALVFVLFYFYTAGNLSLGIYCIVIFNLFVFSIYAWQAPLNESNNVTKWVNIENKVSLLSVLLISLTLFINSIYKFDFENIILLRLGIVFFLMNVSHFLLFRNPVISASRLKKYFGSVDVIIFLFLVKIFYFDMSTGTGEIDGYGVKLYLIFYDMLAAVFGLYIRRVIAINSADFGNVNYALFVSNFSLITFYLVSLIFIDLESEYYHALVSCIVFVSLAINYNYFSFKGYVSSLILKFLYVIIFSFLYYIEIADYFILFVFVNFLYSCVLYTKRVSHA